MRRSSLAFGLIAFGAVALLVEAGHAQFARAKAEARLDRTRDLVRAAGLTDLALFTSARYTRHPSMADLHTPFQDNPLSFEHFPSGSFAPRPASTWGEGALGFDEKEVRR